MAKSEFELIENSNTIAVAAPSAAPEATPRVSGETKGLPKQPCISDPAIPSAAPPTIAIRILGNLISQIMANCISLPVSKPNNILIVVNKSKLADEPRPRDKNASKRVNKNETEM